MGFLNQKLCLSDSSIPPDACNLGFLESVNLKGLITLVHNKEFGNLVANAQRQLFGNPPREGRAKEVKRWPRNVCDAFRVGRVSNEI